MLYIISIRLIKSMGQVFNAGKQGKCYKIAFKDGNKSKKLVVHPLHLIKMKGE